MNMNLIGKLIALIATFLIQVSVTEFALKTLHVEKVLGASATNMLILTISVLLRIVIRSLPVLFQRVFTFGSVAFVILAQMMKEPKAIFIGYVLTALLVVALFSWVVKIKNFLTRPRRTPLEEVAMIASDSQTFYRSSAWRKARLVCLQNSPRKCYLCGRSDVKSWHVDHILPRSIFPAFALSSWNHGRMCEDCNLGKSNQVTKHEVEALYNNFKNQGDVNEFEGYVRANTRYAEVISKALNKRVA